MSYQLKVIQDYPIGFWPLDEIYQQYYSVTSYNDSDSSYNEAALYNSPLVYANDYSGCNNNASYVGDFADNVYTLPLVSGGGYGTKITTLGSISVPITKNYYGASTAHSFGTKYSYDNDFTLEVWVYPGITTSNVTAIFADASNNIGIFWDNGDIVFKVSSTKEIRHKLTYTKKSIYIAAVYSVDSISLYVDGVAVAGDILSGFKFTNSSINLSIGPTLNTSDSFIVDAPAIYRYSLPGSSILKHYNYGNLASPSSHVVVPDEGSVFSVIDAKIKKPFVYSYPESRPWTEFLDSNTYYDQYGKYIAFNKTETAGSKTFIINDSFMIPTQLGLNSSKIEWRGNLGISVETSIDGTNYVSCTNGSSLPQFNKSSFDTGGKVWVRITMSTSDSSKYLPRLSFFAISFFNNKDSYADNSGDKISSSSEYDLGPLNYPVFSRNYSNGIRPASGTGFNLSTISSIRSVELFFTPSDLSANTLLYTLGSGGYTTSRLAWNGSGVLSKTNVAAVYVNGLDKSSATSIADLLEIDEPSHIVIVFTNPISNTIQFNYESTGGGNHLYNNIAIYKTALTLTDALTHFNLYTGKPSLQVSEPVITLTEEDAEYYNNEWVVIQSV